MRLLAPLLLLALCAACLHAQSAAATGEPPPIQDNSFLIEEAYNQEPGVVQHINTFQRLRGGPWVATFTQEWPVPGQAHQLSYAIAWQRVEGEAGRRTGLGDLAVNYRYQLVGSGEAKLAIAPRLSVLLPTGDESKGLGAGATGFQLNVPVSTVLSGKLVAHWNAGATYTPRARNARGDRADTAAVNLGQSTIFHVSSSFDLMLEAAWNRSQSVSGPGQTARQDSFFLNPGVRFAMNFAGGLQIVPGIAAPIGAGPSRGDRAVLLYLSFEHPMWKAR
jgi:hypothetical protein